MLDSVTEEKLLKQASRGDETAFLLLYERHRDGICRFVYRFLGSAELAQEITHDCFLSLVRKPTRFDPKRASLRTYLFAAARNLAFKHLRQAGNKLLVYELPEDVSQTDRIGRYEPLRNLLDRELSDKVKEAVAELAPLQREALILFECEELTLGEIAAITGADIGTIKGRLHRARVQLRRLLAPYFKSDSSIITVEAYRQ